MSALGLDSDRKLFLPEEINFPNANMDLLSSPDLCYEDGEIANSSLLHQILKGGAKSSLHINSSDMIGSGRKKHIQRYDSRSKLLNSNRKLAE